MPRWLTLVVLAVVAAVAACRGDRGSPRGQAAEPAAAVLERLGVPAGALTETPSGLRYHDLRVGEGETAAPGRATRVHYTGWLASGKQFDSSRGRNPFRFPLGAGRVIPGWDEGVAGMRVGGRRVLVIPAALGYGAAGAPPDIPPGATLVFDVELLDVQ